TLIAAVESNDPVTGRMRGTTENYAEAVFGAPVGERGDLIPVRIDAVRGEHLEGTAV
ncbi:MAG: hypothetical protein H6Q79_2030, partial [Deltaproteobacteria bacterium]|nr:hypothetical protein [Deltaproteobacteria bacterium]